MVIEGTDNPYTPTPFLFPAPIGREGKEFPSLDGEPIHPHRVVKAFLSQMKIMDPNLLAHSRSVARYALLTARGLQFRPEQERKVFYSSLLHDLGMMTVDRQILEKKGSLTFEEWQMIQTHPVNAERILSAFPCFRDITPIIRHHHEWYNGMGYPDGLMGENIPFLSRLISVADAFDAMTHDRPYREALSVHDALHIIEEDSGRQFDPKLTGLFVTVILDDLQKRRVREEVRTKGLDMILK